MAKETEIKSRDFSHSDNMSSTKTNIKICGIKRVDEVEIINQFPIQYAGFIFAKSKRQVTLEQCNELQQLLREDVKRVGVFVNEPVERVNHIGKMCKLDVIQLHGDETVDYIKKITLPVWKTLPIKDRSSLEQVSKYEDVVEGILFETYHKTLKGGTGKSFDWSLVESVKPKCRVILAGGIHPENALKAINQVKPAVLDVNSGVEVDGYKTIEKVKQLFKELKL